MLATIIAQRYAKALLSSATDEGVEDRLVGEVSALAEALGEDADVRRFLAEPLSSADDKLGVLLSAFPEPPHALLKQFLRTVMENRRERFLPGMLREFLKLLRETKGELRAELATAFKLDDRQRKLLETELSKRFDRNVELIPVVDRHLVGGATLRVGDTIYDGSLKGALAKLEASLKKAPAPKRLAKPKATKKKKPAAKPKAQAQKKKKTAKPKATTKKR
jgi:F-type H+-transporting ATPase subunit delta